MNERIRELAEQAGFIHDHMSVGERNDALKKFEKCAELIVRECTDKIERDYKYERGEDIKWITAFDIASDLKAHFGVE